jgi:hypothetical protein
MAARRAPRSAATPSPRVAMRASSRGSVFWLVKTIQS